jgi:hypothetical protein
MELAASNQSLISFGVPTMAHHLLKEEIKDNRGVIRIHKSKKDRQHDDKKINNNRTNNYLHNTKHKTKKWEMFVNNKHM